ncbi:hypothetical protein TNCV_1993031 [Trichonephila clavipes]|nr:hypothetical protein TNCV_1993031 [Trichonephila clavipes]
MGLRTLNVGPCYYQPTSANDVGGFEYHQHLPHHFESGHLLAYSISNVLSCCKPPTTYSFLNLGNEIKVTGDEAHFWLNGYVNKQNCRIWSEANPQVYVETPLHPEKLTVWCALWAGGIIGPYFFKNDEGHNVKVNGDRYRAMITNFFILDLNNHDIQELWF